MAITPKDDFATYLEENGINVPKTFNSSTLYKIYSMLVTNEDLSDAEKETILNDSIENATLQSEAESERTRVGVDKKIADTLKIYDDALNDELNGVCKILASSDETQEQSKNTTETNAKDGKSATFIALEELQTQAEDLENEQLYDQSKQKDKNIDPNIIGNLTEKMQKETSPDTLKNKLTKILDEQLKTDLQENKEHYPKDNVMYGPDTWYKKNDSKEPETKEPETKEPETKEPETKEPETKEPETKEPETKESEANDMETNDTKGTESKSATKISDNDQLSEAVRTLKKQYNKWKDDIEDYADKGYKTDISVDENGETIYTAIGDKDGTKLRKTIDQEFRELQKESERVYQMSEETFNQSQQAIEQEAQTQKKSKTKDKSNEQAVDAEYKTLDDETENKSSFADRIREHGREKSQKYDEKIQKYHKQVEARKNYNNKYNDADLSYRSARSNRLAAKANRLNNKKRNLQNAHGLNKLRKLEVNIHAAEVNWRAVRANKKVQKIRRKQLRAEERYERAKEREERAIRRQQRNEHFTEKEAKMAETVSKAGKKMSEGAKYAYNKVYNGIESIHNKMNPETTQTAKKYYTDMKNYHLAIANQYGPDNRTEAEKEQFRKDAGDAWEHNRETIAKDKDMGRVASIFATISSGDLHSIDLWSIDDEGRSLGINGGINGLGNEEYAQISESGQKLADQCQSPSDYLEALEGIQAFECGIKSGLKESNSDEVVEIVTNSNLKQIEYRMADPILKKAAEHWDELPENVQEILSEYPAEGVSSMQDYLNGTQIAPEAGFAGFEEDSSMMAILNKAEREDMEMNKTNETPEKNEDTDSKKSTKTSEKYVPSDLEEIEKKAEAEKANAKNASDFYKGLG